MATIPCWVSIPMFLMTTNRLKVVSSLSNYPACHFYHLLPLLEPPWNLKLSKSRFMATILCWVPIPMLLITKNRLKWFQVYQTYGVPLLPLHFLPLLLLEPPRSSKLSQSKFTAKIPYQALSDTQIALSGFQSNLAGLKWPYQALRVL